MTGSPTPPRVRPRDIADLLAWAASLTPARRAADPAAWAAYLQAKADLLTRIAAQHTDEDPHHAKHTHRIAEHTHRIAEHAHRIAEHAHRIARHATTPPLPSHHDTPQETP